MRCARQFLQDGSSSSILKRLHLNYVFYTAEILNSTSNFKYCILHPYLYLKAGKVQNTVPFLYLTPVPHLHQKQTTTIKKKTVSLLRNL